MLATLPPMETNSITCSIIAAMKYGIPANILLAIAEIEAGKPYRWEKNKNGSYDVGVMQFNTAYLADLARFGIQISDVEGTGCYPFDLAAWRLRRHFMDKGKDMWTQAANYHSKTPALNQRYRAQLINKAAKWAKWLGHHFKTYPIAYSGIAPTLIRDKDVP